MYDIVNYDDLYFIPIIFYSNKLNCRFLRKSGFIVFLNKQDILKEKIRNGRKLGDYFPAFHDFQLDNKDILPDEDYEYLKARCFIRKMFVVSSCVMLKLWMFFYVGMHKQS